MLRTGNRAAGLRAGTPTSTPSTRQFRHVRSAQPDGAASSGSEAAQGTDSASQAPQAPIVDKAFPKTGLFSIADPKQEVSYAGCLIDTCEQHYTSVLHMA